MNNKYKIKNNQRGGNLNLSGPNIIGYFVNTKLNKKIIILGDIHGGTEGKCAHTETPSITQYIQQINTDYPIDIFIETSLPSYKFLSNPNDLYLQIEKINLGEINDFLKELVNYSLTNYKSDPNKRFHYNDIRYNIFGHESYRNSLEIINMIKDDKIKVQDGYLGELFHNLVSAFVFNLININRWINNPEFHLPEEILPYHLFKEYRKLYEVEPENLNSIVKILSGFIRNFLDNYFDSLENLSIDMIDDLYRLGMIAAAGITDFYTVARIMKSTEFNNCVIYGGSAHYFNLKQYLKSIGFELVKEISSSDENFRCVENIIDFKDFFKSN